MKKFFENYGLVALSAIVIIVLIIIASPVGNAIENSTTSIVGSFAGQVNNNIKDNVNTLSIPSKTKIIIEGRKYIVLQRKNDTNYLVLDVDGLGRNDFDKDDSSVYEGSDVDAFLSNDYYNSLSRELKNAIVETTIQQKYYEKERVNHKYIWSRDGSSNPDGCVGSCVLQPNGKYVPWNQHTPIRGEGGMYRFINPSFTNLSGITSNSIHRKIYLPSLEELSYVVNLNDELEMDLFARDSNGNRITGWLRDAEKNSSDSPLYVEYAFRSINFNPAKTAFAHVRPAFVIDLSKINYSFVNK